MYTLVNVAKKAARRKLNGAALAVGVIVFSAAYGAAAGHLNAYCVLELSKLLGMLPPPNSAIRATTPPPTPVVEKSGVLR